MLRAFLSGLTKAIVLTKHKMMNMSFAKALVRHICVQVLTNSFPYAILMYLLCELGKFLNYLKFLSQISSPYNGLKILIYIEMLCRRLYKTKSLKSRMISRTVFLKL